MFGANWVNNSTNEKICIFDILNVNKYMLKNSVFIVKSLNKFRIISLYLSTFNNVIINSTISKISKVAILLINKGFQEIGSLFFFENISLY